MSKKFFHAAAPTLALLLIATFWVSTVVAEVFLGADAVVLVKHHIAYYGLACMVVLLAATGGSGFSLAAGRKARLIDEKRRRMPLIAGNGLLVMIPSALFLNARASAGVFDAWFYGVQAIELVGGIVQITLIGRNFRAGLRLGGRRPATAPAGS